ncbi:hypothetical protein ABW19_dt0207647 [Dactylella cylindrospora]|nr:hypothetical protein ABW19_dt0207647 [Dactylella cylindrospora]
MRIGPEYIIQGIREKFSSHAANGYRLIGSFDECSEIGTIGYQNGINPHLRGPELVSQSLFQFFKVVCVSDQLSDLFLDAIKAPTEDFLIQHYLNLAQPVVTSGYYASASDPLATLAANLVVMLTPIAQHLSVPSVPTKGSHERIEDFLSRFRGLLEFTFQCGKPPPKPNLSLPEALPCHKSNCPLCGALNNFLTSSTRHHFSQQSQAGFKSHFVDVAKDLGYGYQKFRRYQRRDALTVSQDGSSSKAGNVTIRVDKVLWAEYQARSLRFTKDVQERKRLFGMMGMAVDDEGRVIEGEKVWEASVLPQPGLKRKADTYLSKSRIWD